MFTDHSSLCWLSNMKDPDGRLAHWVLKLQHYDYKIIHQPGSQHLNADGLSILPIYHINVENANYLYDLMYQKNLWTSLSDIQLSVFNNLSKNTRINNNQLEKFVDPNWLPYIKPSQHNSLIAEAHHSCGHGRLDKTYDMLKSCYYWEGMKSNVQLYLNSCLECSQFKNLPKRFSFVLNDVTSPFHCVSIDIVGPLPKSLHSNQYIIVAINLFTKWVEALTVNNISSITTPLFIYNYIIFCHGCPYSILSDNSKNFIADTIKTLLKLMGINQIFTVPYSPSSNGTVERVNGTLVSIIKKLTVDQPSNWDEFVLAALFAYRISHHKAIKMSPFKALYGRDDTLPSSVALNLPFHEDININQAFYQLMKVQLQASDTSIALKFSIKILLTLVLILIPSTLR